ncbi:hypothetical protein BDN70DRAFT_894365 [Pholiota conissans]|uniref:Uncharacterized protein n=1 Tax=Pholiota conissans TaxID=109636 RepID=A0A9P5Z565_9AGAR|nr:hypothetical protein BDN70DRAFT_894365 [Pholiota conissans]
MMMRYTKRDRPDQYSFLEPDSLTFAVIWDPKNGLEAFSAGPPGLFDSPNNDISSTKPESKLKRDPSKANFSEIDEPFAVFGSRQLHFIDIRSSKLYERFVAGDFNDNVSLHSGYSSDSFYSTDSAPASYLHLPGKRSTYCPAGNERSSSMQCEESAATWENYSHFLARVKAQDIDDEGFFEASSHADCDPHLPSRFSMSTGFTSAFVAAKKTPPIPILGRITRAASMSNDRTPKKETGGTTAKISVAPTACELVLSDFRMFFGVRGLDAQGTISGCWWKFSPSW